MRCVDARGAGGGGAAAVTVRDAGEADLGGLLTIYNEVIENSTAVFSDQQVTLEDRADWLAGRQADGFPVLVATDAGGVVAFGSFGAFRTWPCRSLHRDGRRARERSARP